MTRSRPSPGLIARLSRKRESELARVLTTDTNALSEGRAPARRGRLHGSLKAGLGRTLIGALLLLLPLAIGCGGRANDNVTVSGVVTVDGKPLSGAVITLEPISDTTGPNASVPVLGGRFTVGAGAGLHGGRYRVRLSMIPAELRAGIPLQAGFEMPPAGKMIDPAFDANSTLTCSLNRGENTDIEFDVRFLN